MTTEQTTRYRIRADVLDTRPLPSVQWWARTVADIAESVEGTAALLTVAPVIAERDRIRRQITNLTAALESLTDALDRLDTEGSETAESARAFWLEADTDTEGA